MSTKILARQAREQNQPSWDHRGKAGLANANRLTEYRVQPKILTLIRSLAFSTAAIFSRSTTHQRALPTKLKTAVALALR